MGKDKDVPRKKKTAKGPSSSAQAADLLSKRGGSNAFAKFKASAITQDFSSSSGEPILASFDAVCDFLIMIVIRAHVVDTHSLVLPQCYDDDELM